MVTNFPSAVTVQEEGCEPQKNDARPPSGVVGRLSQGSSGNLCPLARLLLPARSHPSIADGACEDRHGARSQRRTQPAGEKLLFSSSDLQSVLWLAPPWRFPTGRWLRRWSRLGAGAARRSDSDAQVARYPPAGRVFRSLIIAGLNESSNRVSRMS